MTVASTISRKEFAGDGVTVAFATSPMVFFAAADLDVYIVVIATGVATLQTITTHYTVSGGAGSTGTVTMLTAPTSLQTLLIVRTMDIVQQTDLVNNDNSDAEVLEDSFDKGAMMMQQLSERLDRVIKLPVAETGTPANSELPFDRAGKFLSFDASKNLLASVGNGAPTSAFMATVLDDTTAIAARATLGVATMVDVLRYGADPTGVADSTAAFQSAVDSGFAIVYIPAGTYLIAGEVNITNHLSLIGGGGDFTNTGTAITNLKTNSNTNNILKVNAHNVILEAFNITGLAARDDNNSSGRAIVVGSVERTVADGAITIGLTTLTSATAAFTAADVGSYVSIAGAYTGTSTPTITVFTNATTVTVSIAADVTVTGASTTVAPVIQKVAIRDCSASSHSIGVDFKNAANFTLDNCSLNGFYGVRVDSVAPDKGDSIISNCHLSAPVLTDSAALRWNASGDLKIVNTKFLDCYNSVFIAWTKGTSGGAKITNCSFENHTNFCIRAEGSGTITMNGFIVNGCWLNGGTRLIHIDDSLTLNKLTVTGNVITAGGAVTLTYIGAKVSEFLVTANNFVGAGSATGVSIVLGATKGLVRDNNYFGCSTRVSNAAASTASVLVDDGQFYAKRSAVQSISDVTFTKLQCDTEDLDRSNWYDNVTNFRYLPLAAGDYMFNATAVFASLTAGRVMQMRLMKNGGAVKTIKGTVGATAEAGISIDGVFAMNGTTDYMEVEVYHNNGAPANVEAANTTFSGRFLG